jgi:hypothetical protein
MHGLANFKHCQLYIKTYIHFINEDWNCNRIVYGRIVMSQIAVGTCVLARWRSTFNIFRCVRSAEADSNSSVITVNGYEVSERGFTIWFPAGTKEWRSLRDVPNGCEVHTYIMWYMVWYDMIWYGMIWYMIWCVMIWYMIWCVMIWYMIWYGMVWNDMVWYNMVWYGMV